MQLEADTAAREQELAMRPFANAMAMQQGAGSRASTMVMRGPDGRTEVVGALENEVPIRVPAVPAGGQSSVVRVQPYDDVVVVYLLVFATFDAAGNAVSRERWTINRFESQGNSFFMGPGDISGGAGDPTYQGAVKLKLGRIKANVGADFQVTYEFPAAPGIACDFRGAVVVKAADPMKPL